MAHKVIYPSGKIIEFPQVTGYQWLGEEFILLQNEKRDVLARISKVTGVTLVRDGVKINIVEG